MKQGPGLTFPGTDGHPAPAGTPVTVLLRVGFPSGGHLDPLRGPHLLSTPWACPFLLSGQTQQLSVTGRLGQIKTSDLQMKGPQSHYQLPGRLTLFLRPRRAGACQQPLEPPGYGSVTCLGTRHRFSPMEFVFPFMKVISF